MTHIVVQPEIAYARDSEGELHHVSAVPRGFLFSPLVVEIEQDFTQEEFFEFLKSRLVTI